MTGSSTATGLGLAGRRISVRFDDRMAVDGVDLEVEPGEWLGLVGPNGAGKSTLLRALAGLVGHRGAVTMADGRRPGPLDLALVPQHPTIPAGMSVSEYVMIGRTAHLGWLARESSADRAVVAAVLRRLDLGEFGHRVLTSLSGGELQRVVIARALAQQTPILLLDEPTSALDIGHQVEVLELVDQLRRDDGLSVIAVMHDLTTAARFADRLALLDRGRLLDAGPPAEVLVSARLSSVFGAELTVRTIDGDLVVLPAPRSRPATDGEDPS